MSSDSPSTAPTDDSMDTAPAPATGVASPLLGLLVGFVIGGLMWLALYQWEPQHPEHQPFSTPAEVIAKTEGYVVPPKEIQIEIEEWERFVAVANDVFFLTLWGVLLTLGLSVAQGLYQPSAGAAIVGGIVAVVIGALFGAGAGFAGHYSFKLLPDKTDMDPLVLTIVAQGIMLGILGAGVGLAFGMLTRGQHGVVKSTAFGLLAGILASMAFAVSTSMLTPTTDTFATIPESVGMGRVLWCLVIGVVVACMVTAAGPGKSKGPSEEEAESSESE